jgi:hypothetical protein
MAELSGNVLVPGGRIGSGEAQVFNPMPTLGVLGNLANRRDAMAKFEALQRMKANKPVKEEPIKYPEFDVAAKGGLFNVKFAEERQRAHLTGIDAVRKSQGDPYATAMITSKINNEIAGKSAFLEQQKERFYKTSEELNKTGYTFDPDKVAFELTEKGDNYLDPSLNVKMVEKVKRNPAYFNYAQLGKKAADDAGMKDVEIIDIDGNTTKTKLPVFVNYNGKTGKIEVKTSDGLKYLKQNPVIKEQLPFVYEELFDQFGYDKNILSKAYEDLTDAEKGILLKVTDKAVDRYIGGRLGFEVVNDYETNESKARGEARGAKLADIEEVDTPVKINYKTKYEDGYETVTPINFGVGKSVRLKQPAEIGSNRKVYLLGGDVSNLLKEEGSDGVELVSKQPDGSYLLNFGFKAKEFQRVENALQLTKDTKFRTPDGKVRVRQKGSLISPLEAQSLRKIGQGDHFRKTSGYRLSPGTFQVDKDAEKVVGPVFQGLDIFIPGNMGEVPELENVNPRKKPVVQVDEIDIGFD